VPTEGDEVMVVVEIVCCYMGIEMLLVDIVNRKPVTENTRCLTFNN